MAVEKTEKLIFYNWSREMRNLQRLKNDFVEKNIFIRLNYRMQGIKKVDRENVTSVRQQDILINFVNSVLVYTYRAFSILRHLEMKKSIISFINVKYNLLFRLIS